VQQCCAGCGLEKGLSGSTTTITAAGIILQLAWLEPRLDAGVPAGLVAKPLSPDQQQGTQMAACSDTLHPQT